MTVSGLKVSRNVGFSWNVSFRTEGFSNYQCLGKIFLELSALELIIRETFDPKPRFREAFGPKTNTFEKPLVPKPTFRKALEPQTNMT